MTFVPDMSSLALYEVVWSQDMLGSDELHFFAQGL